MNKKPDSPSAAELRRLAEERLREKPMAASHLQTEADLRRLHHELEVHQIELEMQNDELQRAQAETRTALEKYTDLYDFAPNGYFSLSVEGIILSVNLTGARLVNVERSRLLNRSFLEFILETDRPAFQSFLQRIFTEKGREICEVTLLTEGTSTLIVSVDAMLSKEGRECRASVQDVTDRALLEQQLRKHDALLRMMIARSVEPMLLVDNTGIIVCASNKAAVQLGYSLDELEGAPVTRLLYHLDRVTFAFQYEELKKNAPLPSNAMLRVQTKSGEWRWVSVTVSFEDYLQPSGKYLVKFQVVDTSSGG